MLILHEHETLGVWIWSDGDVHIDSEQNHRGDAHESTAHFNVKHLRGLIAALEAAADEWEDQHGDGSDPYAERAEAISGTPLLGQPRLPGPVTAAPPRPGPVTIEGGEWDPETAVAVYDGEGEIMGFLQPVDYEAIARNPSLQPWSRGTRATPKPLAVGDIIEVLIANSCGSVYPAGYVGKITEIDGGSFKLDETSQGWLSCPDENGGWRRA